MLILTTAAGLTQLLGNLVSFTRIIRWSIEAGAGLIVGVTAQTPPHGPKPIYRLGLAASRGVTVQLQILHLKADCSATSVNGRWSITV